MEPVSRERRAEGTSISREKKTGKKALVSELKQYQSEGVSLWLDGRPSSPRKIAKACKIAEDGIYMRDYVPDEKGGIKKLKFDYVNLKNK